MSSSCLFNYDEIQKNADFIIVTEGPREVLKLWQEGFKNSVAVLGSNIHDGQVELLSELAPKKVVIMFDGDDKGVEASVKVGKKLKRIFSTEIAYPPRGSDPKNLSCNELKKLIKYAKTI
jgi:DNA primase